ncbi:sensor histidine kinase [Nakamurella lactea]|uniref:sensor histidine kinase n=1 Tax=Nakamurella lactea TaxID=459515 RepID=UPI0013781017|nr:HAMP domain-containing sensor histidine kinase [Nakamurella lactea]
MLTAFTSTLVLVVLGFAALPLVHTRVTGQLDQNLRQQILAIADYILSGDRTDQQVAAFTESVDTVTGTRIGVKTPFHTYVGSDAAAVRARWPGTYSVQQPRSPLDRLSPRFYVDQNGDRIASQGVFTGTSSWIVEGTITRDLIRQQERQRWLLIAGSGAGALVVSLGAALLLARRITRPIDSVLHAAESLGRGDLNTPVPVKGPPEIVNLGVALTQLSGRIERLLARERERAADVSHQLRTPLTVLSLETERLEAVLTERPEQLRRVQQAILALEQGLDNVINESRHRREDGLAERSDAVEVLREQFRFWSAAAKAQDRQVQLDGGSAPLFVALSTKHLGTAIDAVVSNIYRHTPPGVGYSATVRQVDNTIVIRVRNADPGAPHRMRPPAAGSTGIGLSIARSALEASGGSLTAGHDGADWLVTMTLKSYDGPLTKVDPASE